MLELAILALLPCINFSTMDYHIHVHVTGVDIPAGIGISQGCFREIHTHDTTGWLHLESSEPKEFTLRQFYEIWGEPTEGIQPIINGKWETLDTPLHDRDNVKLVR